MADDKKSKKFEPKYIAKIKLDSDTYRYFYDLDEYRSYLKSKQAEETKSKVTKGKSIFDKLKSAWTSTSTAIKNTVNAITEKVESGKQIVDKLIQKSSKTTVASAATSKQVEVGKKIASKVLKNYGKPKIIESSKSTIHETTTKLKPNEKVVALVEMTKDTTRSITETVEKSNISAESVSGLSEVGKKAIASLLGGVIGLAIYSIASKIAKKANLTETQEYKEYSEEFLNSESPKSFDELDRLPGPIDDDEDQATINEWYNLSQLANDGAATQNCSYCTAAYDLRQRGYDVEAAPWTDEDDATTCNEIASWYDGAEPYTCQYHPSQLNLAVGMVKNELLKQGDGARGHFMLYWSNGGGHDVVYEVTGNKVILRDCQTNEVLELKDYMQYAFAVTYFRTDNIEPNEKILDKVRNNDD